MVQHIAVLFDLDGVLTPTAQLHMRAWSDLFTPWCATRGVRPYSDQDYFDYIDGKPRYEGVAAFLASRDVDLPWGSPSDDAGMDTICALGNAKDGYVNEIFEKEGIVPYAGSVRFLDQVCQLGASVAVVSSSKNAPGVLAAAGLADRFAVVVDGNVAAAHGIAGKPAPDTYLYAAELLSVDPGLCVVVEDAVSGVAAGRSGNFGVVLGVDRGTGGQALKEAGADVVVEDLSEIDADALVTRVIDGAA